MDNWPARTVKNETLPERKARIMRELVARTTITVCYWKRREERLRQPTGTIGWDTDTESSLAMEVPAVRRYARQRAPSCIVKLSTTAGPTFRTPIDEQMY